MINLRSFIPVVFFFLLYLILQIFKVIFFFLYLVQLKEYRLDRLKAHFCTKTGLKQLWEYFNILKWRDIFRPKFTLRMLIIIIFTFLLEYNFFFYVLRFSFRQFKNLSFNIIISLLFAFLLLNLVTPIIVLIATGISYFLIWPFKKIIIILASQKIKQKKNLLVIGITGSFGKTTVKEIIAQVLADYFKVLKTPVNCNTQLGIAGVILTRLRKKHEIFIVEMGAYRKGEIASLCRMVRPKIGIITGINEQHLALFGTLADTQWAKFELIKSLPSDGLAIINAQNIYTQRLYKATTKVPKRLYGGKKISLKIPLNVFWNKENACPALLVGDYLGIAREKMLSSLKKIKELPWGLRIKTGIKGVKVIDDTYSSNPAGFFSALGMLKKNTGWQRILITPGIIELGKSTGEIHKKIGRKAAQICTKVFLTKVDFANYLKKGVGKLKDKNFVEVVEDEILLVDKLRPMLDAHTVILLEGRVPNFLLSQLKLQ